MPDIKEYSQLAANAYAELETVVNAVNAISLPDNWEIFLIDGQTGRSNPASGFLARAYRNIVTDEIVIAYGGTTFEGGGLLDLRDWIFGNVPAATGKWVGG